MAQKPKPTEKQWLNPVNPPKGAKKVPKEKDWVLKLLPYFDVVSNDRDPKDNREYYQMQCKT